jgi:hypothetical protein
VCMAGVLGILHANMYISFRECVMNYISFVHIHMCTVVVMCVYCGITTCVCTVVVMCVYCGCHHYMCVYCAITKYALCYHHMCVYWLRRC